MKRSTMGFLTALVLLSPALGWADGPALQATLDHREVGLRDSVNLQVTESGDSDMSEPQLPDLSQFAVQESGRSQTMFTDNGVTTNQVTLQYTLTPRRTGTLTIGPITAEVDGQTVSSKPLALEVTAGASPSAPAWGGPPAQAPQAPRVAQSAPVQVRGPAFVTAEVDDKTPYVGQTVTYRLRLYRTEGVQLAGQPQLPNTTGFIAGTPSADRSYTTSLGGTEYRVDEVTMTLVPTGAGKLELGAAKFQCVVPFRGGTDEDQLLGLMGQASPQELASDSVELNVRATPVAGRPDDFTGGIGKLSVAAKLATSSTARVGQPLDLQLSVEGKGNLDLVQAPPMPAMPGFRVLDPVPGAPAVGGRRNFTVTLIPTRAGKLEIPSLSLSSFDPASEHYQSAHTEPLSLEVAPDAVVPTKSAPLQTPAPARHPWVIHRLLDALAALSLLGLLIGCWRWGGKFFAVRRKRGSLLKRAQAQLQTASGLSAASPILRRYLAEKLGHSLATASLGDLTDELLRRGGTEDLVRRFSDLMAQAERARYSANPEAGRYRAAEVRALLQELERSLR